MLGRCEFHPQEISLGSFLGHLDGIHVLSFFETLLDRFLSLFLPSLAPFWFPNSKTIGEKSMPRCLPKLRSISYRFLIDFRSIFLLTSTCAILPILVFPKGKRGFLRKAVFDVLSMLNFNLMPTCLHFAYQNRSKIHENVDPKRVPIMHPFSLRFWIPKTSFLGPNLEPSWPSVSLQDGPRSFPDPPKRLPRPLRVRPGASIDCQNAPRRL